MSGTGKPQQRLSMTMKDNAVISVIARRSDIENHFRLGFITKIEFEMLKKMDLSCSYANIIEKTRLDHSTVRIALERLNDRRIVAIDDN
jgi:hypothetical protein